MAKIWIVLQQRGGSVSRISWEAVAAGQRLASELGGTAEAVVLGDSVGQAAEEAGKLDLAAVHVAEHAALAEYTPGGYVGALAPAIRDAKPDWVIFPHTYQTVDYAARLAQELSDLGAAYLPEVTGFETGDDGLVWSRPVLGGKMVSSVRVRGDGPVLVTVQSGAFSGDGAAAGEAPVSELHLGEVAADREIVGVEEVGGDQVDLTKANVIVAVGRGIGGADKLGPVEELAAALGAEIAASRPVIDNEWLPRDRQIGSSGQTVAPKLYIAAAISGAIQHVVGMKGSRVVVAINKDANAPIMNLADYAIVGDVHEVLPALTEAVKEAKGG